MFIEEERKLPDRDVGPASFLSVPRLHPAPPTLPHSRTRTRHPSLFLQSAQFPCTLSAAMVHCFWVLTNIHYFLTENPHSVVSWEKFWEPRHPGPTHKTMKGDIDHALFTAPALPLQHPTTSCQHLLPGNKNWLCCLQHRQVVPKAPGISSQSRLWSWWMNMQLPSPWIRWPSGMCSTLPPAVPHVTEPQMPPVLHGLTSLPYLTSHPQPMFPGITSQVKYLHSHSHLSACFLGNPI